MATLHVHTVPSHSPGYWRRMAYITECEAALVLVDRRIREATDAGQPVRELWRQREAIVRERSQAWAVAEATW